MFRGNSNQLNSEHCSAGIHLLCANICFYFSSLPRLEMSFKRPTCQLMLFGDHHISISQLCPKPLGLQQPLHTPRVFSSPALGRGRLRRSFRGQGELLLIRNCSMGSPIPAKQNWREQLLPAPQDSTASVTGKSSPPSK